jgi:D-alanyl-lipoteichoic acid acyltransferase DltB (MBOAT superfamily)
MTLVQTLVFALAGALYAAFGRNHGRGWLLLTSSVLAVYWLQPATPLRYFDFWFPTASLVLAILVWAATRLPGSRARREPVVTGLVVAGVVLLVAATRFLPSPWRLTPTRPPGILETSAVLALAALVCLLALRSRGSRWLLAAFIAVILALFVVLKAPSLNLTASALMRTITGQSPELASLVDLRWLGFSYLAFRLLHTLRDRMTGRLPELSLRQYLTYLVFFPALVAGPIDRAERFAADLHRPVVGGASALAAGGERLILGAFKKFVLADSLAVFALTPLNAIQTTSSLWLWVLLYAISFQLYFDFGGYTDIAIGLGLLLGIRLPENFHRPYLQPNLAAFWNSWHLTLAGWFRSYFFNPLTRWLRGIRLRLPVGAIILVGQLSTMILIGLWHGITWSYVAWGAWHGLGLFLHNRWTDLVRRRQWSPRLGGRLPALAGTLLTFHFVTLGWVWFALPDLDLAWNTFLRLFGL